MGDKPPLRLLRGTFVGEEDFDKASMAAFEAASVLAPGEVRERGTRKGEEVATGLAPTSDLGDAAVFKGTVLGSLPGSLRAEESSVCVDCFRVPSCTLDVMRGGIVGKSRVVVSDRRTPVSDFLGSKSGVALTGDPLPGEPNEGEAGGVTPEGL